MSRIAKNPIEIPNKVNVVCESKLVTITGPLGVLKFKLPEELSLDVTANELKVVSGGEVLANTAKAGTARAILSNIVNGVHKGYERKLLLVGVGYRAQAKGKTLSLSLGFSHPLDFDAPEGISIDTPTPTEIVIKGIDKQLVGQVAANIRAFRPPEPYKGKGVRYSDEQIIKKEAKKK